MPLRLKSSFGQCELLRRAPDDQGFANFKLRTPDIPRKKSPIRRTIFSSPCYGGKRSANQQLFCDKNFSIIPNFMDSSIPSKRDHCTIFSGCKHVEKFGDFQKRLGRSEEPPPPLRKILALTCTLGTTDVVLSTIRKSVDVPHAAQYHTDMTKMVFLAYLSFFDLLQFFFRSC